MKPLSAQVLLKTNSGRAPTDAELTAQRIAAVLPSPQLIDSVVRAFAAAGFQVGPVVGLTFSITAPAHLFQAFFALSSAELHAGNISLVRLPAALSKAVAAVVIPGAPAFGPGGGFA